MLILSLKSISKQSMRVIYSERHGVTEMDDESRRGAKHSSVYVPLAFFSFPLSFFFPRYKQPRNLSRIIRIERYPGTDLVNCTPRKNNTTPLRERVMNVNPKIKLAIKEIRGAGSSGPNSLDDLGCAGLLTRVSSIDFSSRGSCQRK